MSLNPTINGDWNRAGCKFVLYGVTRHQAVIRGLPMERINPNSDVYRAFAAIRYHDTWHVEPVTVTEASRNSVTVSCSGYGDRYRAIAYPIDLRMTRGDIEGSRDLRPNADNTGWTFRHTRSGPHQDHELAVIGSLAGAFYPVILQYQVDIETAPTDEARAHARRRLVAVSSFYGETLTTARALAKSKHLGERHKDEHPEDGHVSTEVLAAIETTKTKWTAERSADLALLSTALTFVSRVTDPHDPETRWGIIERLKEESEAGDEPAGFEYIFISTDSATPVTGAENLPEADWNFDRPELKTGLVRGNRTYFDAKPPDVAPTRPLVIRFKRPYTGAPDKNSDIGSVEWIQEPAYYSYGS